MKTRIHVNQHQIRANKKNGTNFPVLSIITYKGTTHAMEIVIKGKSKLVYNPCKPLSCGAQVWIETEAEVEITKE